MAEIEHFRVLIIEDSATMRAVCQQALQQAGFEVETAESAETGYQRLEESIAQGALYDGILLDWVLPDMSGSDLLRKIAAERRFDSVSVMIFTERPDDLAYQLASQRPNNDIQQKEELSLLPYRMRKFLNTYSGEGGGAPLSGLCGSGRIFRGMMRGPSCLWMIHSLSVQNIAICYKTMGTRWLLRTPWRRRSR